MSERPPSLVAADAEQVLGGLVEVQHGTVARRATARRWRVRRARWLSSGGDRTRVTAQLGGHRHSPSPRRGRRAGVSCRCPASAWACGGGGGGRRLGPDRARIAHGGLPHVDHAWLAAHLRLALRIDDLRPAASARRARGPASVYSSAVAVALDQLAIEVQTHRWSPATSSGSERIRTVTDRVGVEERLVLGRLEDLEQLRTARSMLSAARRRAGRGRRRGAAASRPPRAPWSRSI